MNVTVIGAGVIGLTSAIRLREAGFETNVVAAELPVETLASARAGAIWYPYRTSHDERAVRWGMQSLEILRAGARAGAPGLAICEMIELLPEPALDPWWAVVSPGFRRPDPGELPAGFPSGWMIETVTIDVLPHLEYLGERLAALGGAVERRQIGSLEEVTGAERLVVNCAGVGAAELVPDPGVFPIRGQTVRVRGVRVDRVTMVERGSMALAYVMPHGEDCLLGGTADAGAWDTVPNQTVTDEIMEKAVFLEPTLVDSEIVAVQVGLRPGRAAVRLEHEAVAGTAGVIHNYGHAGNGWSLGWGCAGDVVEIAHRVAG